MGIIPGPIDASCSAIGTLTFLVSERSRHAARDRDPRGSIGSNVTAYSAPR
jgi:hypothetical protein